MGVGVGGRGRVWGARKRMMPMRKEGEGGRGETTAQGDTCRRRCWMRRSVWRLPTSRKEAAPDVCMFRSPVTCRDPLGDESDVVSSTENFAACALTNPVFRAPLTVMEPLTERELEAIRFTERPPITRRSPLIVTLPFLNAPTGESSTSIPVSKHALRGRPAACERLLGSGRGNFLLIW